MHEGMRVTPTLRLVRPLGQGAMGSVWVADHLALGTQVAVKFMMPSVARNPELVARFRREATAAAQIKSPHVAQVLDHGIARDESPYIVMELLEGEDLKRRLARLGTLPPPEVARILTQAAKALSRAHQLGIVHRDIKPENLFLLDLDGEPFVKVLDFGIAKQAGSGGVGVTSSGSLLGTPLYMSPEQLFSAKHVDARADQWALGVVAYRALTGRLPFTAETLGALALVVNAGQFTPPSQLRPDLGPAVDAWMTRALARDPACRFGTARELAEELERALGVAGAGHPAPPSSKDLARATAAAEAAPGSRRNDGGALPLLGAAAAEAAPGSRRNDGGALPLPGGEAQERTLQGMTVPGSLRAGRRGPAVIAAMALGGLAAAGGGIVVVTRGHGDGGRELPSSAVVVVAAAQPSSAAEVAPEDSAASAAAPAEAPTLPAAPAASAAAAPGAPASPAASANAEALPAPADDTTTIKRPPASGARAPRAKPTAEDDVGF